MLLYYFVKVNFGHVYLSEEIRKDPPAPLNLGRLGGLEHGVSSTGNVIIADARTIEINGFSYDGQAPGYLSRDLSHFCPSTNYLFFLFLLHYSTSVSFILHFRCIFHAWNRSPCEF